MKLAISSGHGRYVRGASGVVDEVDEARRIVSALCQELFRRGHEVTEIHDDTSTNQDDNLEWLVTQHNRADRELDVSIHLNAYEQTSEPMGTECLYVTQQELADNVASAIARAGHLIDRGPKYRDNLYWLNNTDEPAVLVETIFCDSTEDCRLYEQHFTAIIHALADSLTGTQDLPETPQPPERPAVYFSGNCSWFGGPDDDGVAPDEGLAFIYDVDMAPDLFLPSQPPGTTGLARRLDPDEYYVAARWDYDNPATTKTMLADQTRHALVRANGKMFLCQPADWGPHTSTGRALDISPGLMAALEIETDDEVELIYPVKRLPDRPQPPEPPEEVEEAGVSIQVTSTGPVRITVNGTDIEEL